MIIEFESAALITDDQKKAFKIFAKAQPQLVEIFGNRYEYRMWFSSRNTDGNLRLIEQIKTNISPLGPTIENLKIV